MQTDYNWQLDTQAEFLEFTAGYSKCMAAFRLSRKKRLDLLYNMLWTCHGVVFGLFSAPM